MRICVPFRIPIDASDDEESREFIDEIDAALNEIFRRDIKPVVLEAYSADDSFALDEAFNDWTDSLCRDGEISDFVYDQTCRADD